jgi:hypothetical protein
MPYCSHFYIYIGFDLTTAAPNSLITKAKVGVSPPQKRCVGDTALILKDLASILPRFEKQVTTGLSEDKFFRQNPCK